MVRPAHPGQSGGVEQFLLGLDPWLVYVVVALLAFGESVSFLSLVLPGEIALVAGAAIASLIGVDPVILGTVAVTAAAVGGACGYELGRVMGPSIVAWGPIARRFDTHLPALTKRLQSRGAALVVLSARFNQLTRALAPALAGMARMPRGRFLWANLAGATLWGTAFTLLGVFAARWWQSTSGTLQVILAAVLAATAGAWFALGRSAKGERPRL